MNLETEQRAIGRLAGEYLGLPAGDVLCHGLRQRVVWFRPRRQRLGPEAATGRMHDDAVGRALNENEQIAATEEPAQRRRRAAHFRLVGERVGRSQRSRWTAV